MAVAIPDFSVVICAYSSERWGHLRAAVESVTCQTAPPRDAVVVIDHNPDLYERAREGLAGARVTVTVNSERRGLSGARNTGVGMASGEVVAFLDDDAIAAPDWLEQLRTAYDDQTVVGAGGLVLPLWQTGRPSWFPPEFDWVVGCTYTGMPRVRAPVRNLIGANMSFRRDVFTVAGGFRSDMGRVRALPAGCEETELCIRVRQCWPQRQLLFEPRARVHHHVPADRSRWRYFRSRCYAEGRSKALVAYYVGVKDGLASERVHALHTLPFGAARGLRDVVLHADLGGLARAGVIVAGLALTAAGYVVGTLSYRREPPRG